jgi:hypothetical protein
MKKPAHVILTLLMSFLFASVNAQVKNPYNYQDLSGLFYAKQADSIKKNWNCPKLYKQKETQKKYAEIWDGRVGFITESIKSNSYVYESEVYNYVNTLIQEIVKKNESYFKIAPNLLIDRSSVVNAYAIGGNIIAVNLGLINYVETREELALVIAHELSHNILEHPDNAIKQKAELITSAEYKKQLDDILKSKYERFTKLEKVLESYSFSRSKHNRYHESDADSLAIILLKNANISFQASYFLRLDSSDLPYHVPLQKPLSSYFANMKLPFEEGWSKRRLGGLSTKKYNFSKNEGLADSLKTHPECKERYEKTKAQTNISKGFTQVPASLKDKAHKMMLWNLYDNMNMTASFYRILLEKDKGNKDPWYDFMLHNIIGGLYYADKDLNRFNAINVKQKEYISESYYELQNTFEQMPKEKLAESFVQMKNAAFWNQMPGDAKELRFFMERITSDEAKTPKDLEKLAKKFKQNFETSMYCELADHFVK